jgi:hypothetical protein
VWWHTPIIPTTQEVEVGGSRSQGKRMRAYLENKLNAKGLGEEVGSSGRALAKPVLGPKVNP